MNEACYQVELNSSNDSWNININLTEMFEIHPKLKGGDKLCFLLPCV